MVVRNEIKNMKRLVPWTGCLLNNQFIPFIFCGEGEGAYLGSEVLNYRFRIIIMIVLDGG